MNGILAFLALVLMSTPQKTNNKVLLTVGPEEVTVSDFQSVFQKNNNLDDVTEEEMNEYLDLFAFQMERKQLFQTIKWMEIESKS